MWKKQKVKAGVLLYAVTMAAIFSLLLQFYLNRQVAHHKDFALNKRKAGSFCHGQAQKTRLTRKWGTSLQLRKSRIKIRKQVLQTSVRMNKGNYEFLFPPMKKPRKENS